MAKIAFVGLGTMGRPMAINLVRAGHDLTVHDVSDAAMAEVVQAGAQAADIAAAALPGTDFVVTMLPSGGIVRGVLAGDGGLFAQATGAPLFIDCSTIAPEDARFLAREAEDRSIEVMDAPVSGGVQGARDATLAFMAGGTDRQFAHAQPILSAMGQAVYHAGPAGSGQAAKICNNMLAAIIMAGTAEALALGESLGLDLALLSRIIGKSSGGSFLLDRWNPYPGVVAQAPASRNYDNGFQLQLMLKDIGLALDSARAARRPVPMGSLAQSLYTLQMQDGADAATKDFSKVVDVFRRGLPDMPAAQ